MTEGGGSEKAPKKNDVIYEQPLTQKAWLERPFLTSKGQCKYKVCSTVLISNNRSPSKDLFQQHLTLQQINFVDWQEEEKTVKMALLCFVLSSGESGCSGSSNASDSGAGGTSFSNCVSHFSVGNF